MLIFESAGYDLLPNFRTVPAVIRRGDDVAAREKDKEMETKGTMKTILNPSSDRIFNFLTRATVANTKRFIAVIYATYLPDENIRRI